MITSWNAWKQKCWEISFGCTRRMAEMYAHVYRWPIKNSLLAVCIVHLGRVQDILHHLLTCT